MFHEGPDCEELVGREELAPAIEAIKQHAKPERLLTWQRLVRDTEWNLGKDPLDFVFRLCSKADFIGGWEPIFFTVRAVDNDCCHHRAEPPLLTF